MGKVKKSFEEAMTELESIVNRLEKGELPLEESLECFEKGIELSKCCNVILDEAERKISILIEDEKGDITVKEFKSDAG